MDNSSRHWLTNIPTQRYSSLLARSETHGGNSRMRTSWNVERALNLNSEPPEGEREGGGERRMSVKRCSESRNFIGAPTGISWLLELFEPTVPLPDPNPRHLCVNSLMMCRGWISSRFRRIWPLVLLFTVGLLSVQESWYFQDTRIV